VYEGCGATGCGGVYEGWGCATGCGGGYTGCCGTPVGPGGAGAGVDCVAGAISGAPHESQKASPGMTAMPHCGHTLGPALTAPGWAAAAGWGAATGATGAIAGEGGGVACCAGTGISAAPHWSQKRAEAGLSAPH
jgi:hypothetical protein